MRILFLAWRDLANDLAGGSEVLIDHLASGLTQRGHDVTLMCGDPVEPRDYPVHRNGGTVDQYLRAPSPTCAGIAMSTWWSTWPTASPSPRRAGVAASVSGCRACVTRWSTG